MTKSAELSWSKRKRLQGYPQWLLDGILKDSGTKPYPQMLQSVNDYMQAAFNEGFNAGRAHERRMRQNHDAE